MRCQAGQAGMNIPVGPHAASCASPSNWYLTRLQRYLAWPAAGGGAPRVSRFRTPDCPVATRRPPTEVACPSRGTAALRTPRGRGSRSARRRNFRRSPGFPNVRAFGWAGRARRRTGLAVPARGTARKAAFPAHFPRRLHGATRPPTALHGVGSSARRGRKEHADLRRAGPRSRCAGGERRRGTGTPWRGDQGRTCVQAGIWLMALVDGDSPAGGALLELPGPEHDAT